MGTSELFSSCSSCLSSGLGVFCTLFMQCFLGLVALSPAGGVGSVETHFLSFCSLAVLFVSSKSQNKNGHTQTPVLGQRNCSLSSLRLPGHTVSIFVCTANDCSHLLWYFPTETLPDFYPRAGACSALCPS